MATHDTTTPGGAGGRRPDILFRRGFVRLRLHPGERRRERRAERFRECALAGLLMGWVSTASGGSLGGTGWSGDGEGVLPYVEPDATVKWGGMAASSRGDGGVLTGFGRLRLGLHAHLTQDAEVRAAYEGDAAWTSRSEEQGGAGISGLPASDARNVFRLGPATDAFRRGRRVSGLHGIDRLFLALHPDWGEVTIGRQAIGLGRSRLFGAVDVFAPFSPLDADREWRPGVDAARVEWRVAPTAGIEGIAVGGRRMDDSALILRVRGYTGLVDAEMLGGKRGRDAFAGAAVSGVVGDAEVHGEAAVFRTPDRKAEAGLPWSDQYVVKATLGASRTFPVGNGLTMLGEYHYSGFGVRDVKDVGGLPARPAFTKRILRGDMQILGRQAIGLEATYVFDESLSGALTVLMSPADGSGTIMPSLRWDASRIATVLLVGYMPWGETAENGRMRSEFGSTPRAVFVQLALYF